MDLATYLNDKPATELATKVGVHPSMLSQIKLGRRQCPEALAILIEEATGGAIKVETLRPDIPWHVIRAKRPSRKAA